MATSEETLGLIQGLAAVVKEQNATIKARSEEIASLTSAVKELATHSAAPSQTSLRLPNLTLPEFTGIEHLDRFLEQFSHVLKSSGVHPKHFLTYLKQQCRKDARAFDILCSYEEETLKKLPHSPNSEQYEQFYLNAITTLQAKRGVPKDQQIRNLLSSYYTMRQQPNESVSAFAHRFCELQHSLEKLIPGIHKTSDGRNSNSSMPLP